MTNKSEHYNEVKQFMYRAQQATPAKPNIPNVDIRRLRAKLILEEALETIDALGFNVIVSNRCVDIDKTIFVDSGISLDLVDIVDGCCDIAVVTTGTLIACGVDDIPVQREVNMNNLLKTTGDYSIRADGKLVKPADHPKPQLAKLLELQGWKG